MTQRYKIVRSYRDVEKRSVRARGLSLEEAQAWCRDPETSSRTATNEMALEETLAFGPWFDGYEEDSE